MSKVTDLKEWKKRKFRETFNIPDEAEVIIFMCDHCSDGRMDFIDIKKYDEDETLGNCDKCGSKMEIYGCGRYMEGTQDDDDGKL